MEPLLEESDDLSNIESMDTEKMTQVVNEETI